MSDGNHRLEADNGGSSPPLGTSRNLQALSGSGRLFCFDWCSAGTRTGEGADEQEEKRDFRNASARSRAAKADGVYRRG